MRRDPDSFSDSQILETFAVFKSEHGKKGGCSPKLLVQLRAKVLRRHVDRRYRLLAFIGPLNRCVVGVARVFADPSALNHKIKSVVNRLHSFVRHPSRVAEPPLEKPYRIGGNTDSSRRFAAVRKFSQV